jgi:hypothetical protein
VGRRWVAALAVASAIGYRHLVEDATDPPLAERRYRNPATGEEAVLRVGYAYPPGMRYYEVRVTRPDGTSTVPGIMFATWTRSRAQARELWAARAKALRSAGYERA